MLNQDEFIYKYLNTFQENKCCQHFIEFVDDSNNDSIKVHNIQMVIEKLFNQLFTHNELYIVLFIWNTELKTEFDLMNLGFDYSMVDKVYEDIHFSDHQLIDNPKNTKVNLLYFKNYKYEKIKYLVQATATWELAIRPSANVNAYYISFNREGDILVNFHDDRGLEIITTSQVLNMKIKKTFNASSL